MSFRIVATGLPIAAPCYAALDVTDRLCWTDDDFYAARFDTPSEAERFARALIEGGDWRVIAV